METPRTKEDLIQIFRDAGIEDVSEESIRNALNIFRQNKKAEAEIHRINRAESRAKTLSEKERSARTHKLCQIGGAVLSFFPEIAELSQEEIYELFDKLFSDISNEKIILRAIDNRANLKVGGADG